MSGFKVAAVSDFGTADFQYVDPVELTCRQCEEINGEEMSSFVPGADVKPGQVLACPFCAFASTVPQRRWWRS